MNESVIRALEEILVGDPSNSDVRCHLMSLLESAGNWLDLQKHAQTLLSQNPDHLRGLEFAARAASELGDQQLANRYIKISCLLKGETHSASQETQSPLEQKPCDEDEESQDHKASQENTVEELPLSENVSEFRPKKLCLVDGSLSDPVFETEEQKITLDDVCGMQHVKERLRRSFLSPMQNPEVMKMYGKSLRGGLMLYGPPGCGKTYIAKAIAGELGARFMAIGLSDVLDMYVGQSERNLHEVFQTARRNAPCVLFFDEIDALGRKRSLNRHSASRDVVNQLLSELDNVQSQNKSLFILAATNHPWDVDTALRRPGRFDRMLLVLPPDQEARKAMFQFYLKNKPQKKIDVVWLSSKTHGFSGADIKHLCDSATELAMEDALLSGEVRPIHKGDFKKALGEVKKSTTPWFDTARNYAMFANEGGVYDDLLNYLKTNKSF